MHFFKKVILSLVIQQIFTNFAPVNDILKKESPKFFKTTGN